MQSATWNGHLLFKAIRNKWVGRILICGKRVQPLAHEKGKNNYKKNNNQTLACGSDSMVSFSSVGQSVLSVWSSNQSSSFFFLSLPVIDLTAFCSVRSVNNPPRPPRGRRSEPWQQDANFLYNIIEQVSLRTCWGWYRCETGKGDVTEEG